MRLLLILTSLLLSMSGLKADDMPTNGHQIHYIGFNSLKADNKPAHDKAFRDYIHALTPIMAKHGLTLQVFKVAHQSADQKVDYISFGTAPDQATFQKFFTDPAFHAIFPALVGALDHHFVTFTDGPFMPKAHAKGHQLLSVSWLNDPADASLKAVEKLLESGEAIWARHNTQAIIMRHGVMASTGLADDVEMVAAPNLVEIWEVGDAHGLFDDPDFTKLEKAVKTHVQEARSYWLEPMK
ncbi:MAG: hypothetical protein HWE25_15455 [Alphaproteobacteria bacterium]|nr:hypothetical protein [Alphaproteobacteria bacterium]